MADTEKCWPVIGYNISTRLAYLKLGRADNNVSEVINEWGAYAVVVVPQTLGWN